MSRKFMTKFQYDVGQIGVKALFVATAYIIARSIL
jgi:hypothetical protein